MERLLTGIARNYLPSDWQQLASVLDQTSNGYGELAAELQRIIASSAVLTPQQIGSLSAANRQHLDAARRSAAMLQALTREALAATSTLADKFFRIPRAEVPVPAVHALNPYGKTFLTGY